MTTWTPKPKQDEVWSENATPTHVFDPDVFENTPIFDTYTAGLWKNKAAPADVWIPK